MEEALGDFAKSRSDWTLSRFSDRLNELKRKLQAHDTAQIQLSSSQLSKCVSEDAKLTKLLKFCQDQSLADDVVLASCLTRPKKRANPLATEEKRPAEQKKKKLKNEPKPERSIQRHIEDVQFIKKECLHCRTYGHVLRNCPLLATPGQSILQKTVCWRCGQDTHTLPECTEPVNEESPLPFARCFICGESGHLSAKCDQNPNGIYPKGGSCFRCGSIYHLAKDCEMREEKIEEKRQNRTDKRHREHKGPRSHQATIKQAGERPSGLDKSAGGRSPYQTISRRVDRDGPRRAAPGRMQSNNHRRNEGPSSTPRPFDAETGKVKRPRGTKGGKQVQARRKLEAKKKAFKN